MSFHVHEGQEQSLFANFDLPPQENQDQEVVPSSTHQGRRKRKLPVGATKNGKSETITPPYPWATSKRATVYSLEQLLSHGMRRISGTVQCKRCEEQYDIGFDLQEKFDEVGNFTAENKDSMRDRAPDRWMNPALPTCERCGQENSLKPLITKKKKTTNWLFLFLGQMLGCCKLSYLKYFCKHTKNHRTGAKDRVLYLTYLGLCKQLNPKGPFHT
ncbi:uncharacterized protein LOC133289459 [Gastrolobium bilobum]|uniref:uncharacterized protein LOC133289459 n=1 Tax=Gastrolobium bilobum TaxID=150636 RepID=UPI002AAFE0F1|nr:uncharacterized protein LOC133289459 [Gastrolobium bilobum]